MKVFAFVKIRTNKAPQGATRGCVISFHRTESPRSEEELKFFLPVLVDINIPCGDKYDRGNKCGSCKYNDPQECDVQKYGRAIWTSGDILNPPRVAKKRRYKIDIDSFLSPDSLAVIDKLEKTKEERDMIISNALKNEVFESLILDKVK